MTAPAQTERAAKIERVAQAAARWVYDQECSSALADLEDAVCDLIGREIDGTPREEKAA